MNVFVEGIYTNFQRWWCHLPRIWLIESSLIFSDPGRTCMLWVCMYALYVLGQSVHENGRAKEARMTEYSRVWGCYSPWFFFFFFRMLWSPIFPKKPSTSRVRQDRPNTEHPKNKKIILMEPDGASMYGFFTKAMKWQNRKMSCFFRNPILFLHPLSIFYWKIQFR